jgi:AraC-like DNA-binding protein
MLNLWAIILLLAAGQGILLGVALIIPGWRRDRSNPFLGLMILVISLELLNAWGMQVHYHSLENKIPFWLLESYFILPASLWLFIKANTDAGFQFSKKYLLLYLPAFVEIVTETTFYVRFFLTGQVVHLLDIKAWFFSTEILPVLCMVAVLVFYARNLSRFSQTYRAGMTAASRILMIKMYGLFIILLLLTICWSAEVLLHLSIFTFVEIILISFLFVMGYMGYARPMFFERIKNTAKRSAGVHSFAHYDDKKEAERVTRMLEQNALYTRPGLTIEQLSAELELPPRYVSYLINSHFATSFHHFVNTYRVKEVIRKINDPSQRHKTLLALAFESGFNSKSSFNQVFKKHTGQSPSQLLK